MESSTYALTVVGTVGPVLRGALPVRRAETVETTVIRLDESAARTLLDVLELLEAAGVRVEAVHRLGASAPYDGTGSASPVPDEVRSGPRA